MNKKLYYVLGSILCLYGINQYIDILICLLLGIVLLANINKNDFYYIYFGMIFFEPILNLPFLGGSIFRFYQLFFILKFLLDLKNNNKKIHVKNISFLCGIVLIITNFLYQNMASSISTIINVFIIVYAISKNFNRRSFYQELLTSIGILIFFTTIYGFLKGVSINYGSFVRKTTTISDPNYSALFTTIGMFSIINNNNFLKFERLLLMSCMIISLLMTVSITGIVGTTIFFIIYLCIQNFKKNFKYLILILVFLLLFFVVPIKSDNILYGIKTRIISMENSSINSISSGRTEIAQQYLQQFSTLSITEMLFGGNNTVDGEYRNMMIRKVGNVSHNSVIDMLFMTGIVGTTIIIFTHIYGILKCYKLYKNNNKIALNYVLIKLIMLYYCLTISFFPFRYFVILYILNVNIKKKEMM